MKIQFYGFFKISLVIFDLQRCTVPHFKALDISLWSFVIIFSAKINIWWTVMFRTCPLFFTQTLVCHQKLNHQFHLWPRQPDLHPSESWNCLGPSLAFTKVNSKKYVFEMFYQSTSLFQLPRPSVLPSTSGVWHPMSASRLPLHSFIE